MIPTNILIASLTTFVILLNGTFLTFPKGSRPAEILMKIFCGVAAFFWTVAIFKNPSVGAYVTAGCFAFLAFLIGPLKKTESQEQINAHVNMSPPSFVIGNDESFPFKGYTGKIYSAAAGDNTYLGILDANGDSILLHSEKKFKDNEPFVITEVREGQIFIDKVLK